MNFFNQIDDLLSDNSTINITIKRTEAGLLVSVLPSSNIDDNGLKQITPIILSGKVNEIDENFFKVINKPIKDTNNFIDNVSNFKYNLEKAKEKSIIKEEENKKVEKSITDFNKLISEEKFEEAKKYIMALKDKYPDNKKILKSINDNKLNFDKIKQQDLF